MKLVWTLLFSLFIITGAFSQDVNISGKIVDENNNPVPFASVYIKNTTKGTSANSEGAYRLLLKTGTYELQFKAVGYQQQTHTVELSADKTLNINLKTESYKLADVVISSTGKDPAYAIIRKAIKKRKFHLEEVKAYTCNVYLKGLQKLLAAPKKFMGFDVAAATREAGLDSNRRGIIYLSEAQSIYSFMQPDKVHEEMISSKVSGSNRAFSYNRASDLRVNFYRNIQTWGRLSDRPLISPIADNAMFYYDYKLIGSSEENGQKVDKISVIPKRMYDACFQGYIYILEDDWRIYSLDLFITKKQNLNFVDTLKISQQFFPVNEKTWMTSSIKFEFTGGLLGFRVGGYFISIYKDYDLSPKFTKNEFNEVLKITKGVNKKDSVLENERPIPLTEEEKTDYTKKAILAQKRESKPYLDSLDKANNKLKPVDLLLNGYHSGNRYKHEYYNFDPILASIGFNTVQGVRINYGASYSKLVDTLNNRYLFISAKAGYGFADQKPTGSISASVPAGDSYTLTFNAGSDIVDLNNTNPISPLVNSFYSLFEKENYEKLYQKKYVSLFVNKRITGGWLAYAGAEWADRKWLPNSSNYSFYNPGNKNYTSNNPLTPNQETPLFPDNQSFKLFFRTSYDFSDKYETYPTGRRYLPSPYPTVGLSFTQGVNGILGSDVNYNLLSADIAKSDINAGVLGRTSFFVGAGKFLNTTSLYYPDYKQFAGNEVLFAKYGINSFLLLNYYNFSSYNEYVEAHFEQNFSGFILNKIPLIRKLKLQEIVDINYLSTPTLKNYTELGFGLQYLNFRLMYGTSFNSGSKTTNAIRLGIGF